MIHKNYTPILNYIIDKNNFIYLTKKLFYQFYVSWLFRFLKYYLFSWNIIYWLNLNIDRFINRIMAT